MGYKLKDQAARAEYAMLRMDIALKRTISCEDGVDWERAWKWATT